MDLVLELKDATLSEVSDDIQVLLDSERYDDLSPTFRRALLQLDDALTDAFASTSRRQAAA